jgi:hypothetical protein
LRAIAQELRETGLIDVAQVVDEIADGAPHEWDMEPYWPLDMANRTKQWKAEMEAKKQEWEAKNFPGARIGSGEVGQEGNI